MTVAMRSGGEAAGIELTADTWSAGSLEHPPARSSGVGFDVAADDRVMTARLQGAKDYPFTIRALAAERSGIEAFLPWGELDAHDVGPRLHRLLPHRYEEPPNHRTDRAHVLRR